MSQYTTIYFCKDEQELVLQWWGTTLSRTFLSDAFPYTVEKATFDVDNVIQVLNEGVEEAERNVKRNKDEIAKYESLVVCCKEASAAEALLERIDNTNAFLKEEMEDLDLYQGIVRNMQFIKSIAEENEGWALYYKNC